VGVGPGAGDCAIKHFSGFFCYLGFDLLAEAWKSNTVSESLSKYVNLFILI